MVRILSDIYEVVGERHILTLSHIFYGTTLKRALEIERAHAESDAFFNAAMTTGNYKGIVLEVDRYVERL